MHRIPVPKHRVPFSLSGVLLSGGVGIEIQVFVGNPPICGVCGYEHPVKRVEENGSALYCPRCAEEEKARRPKIYAR